MNGNYVCILCRKKMDEISVRLGPDGHTAMLCDLCNLQQMLPHLSHFELFRAIGGLSRLRDMIWTLWTSHSSSEEKALWERFWAASLDVPPPNIREK